MATKELTHENFDAEIERPGLMIIDFWADWCSPCKAFAPIFEAASEKYPEILFAKVNTEAEPTLSQQFEIHSIPTLFTVKNGEIVDVRMGALTPPDLDAWIRQLIQA